MIIEEILEGRDLVKTYSDSGMMIRQETGALYAEAVDIIGLHTYTETDIPIEDDITDSEALNIIMGRADNEQADGD